MILYNASKIMYHHLLNISVCYDLIMLFKLNFYFKYKYKLIFNKFRFIMT